MQRISALVVGRPSLLAAPAIWSCLLAGTLKPTNLVAAVSLSGLLPTLFGIAN